MSEDLSAEAFYDGLAGDYHLILPADFDLVCRVQGEVLEALLPPPPARILDVSCGIGTQALGLAGRGYDVVGRDLSPEAVERARREADRRHLHLDLAVADMREVDRALDGRFSAAITCDNSLAHLHTDADLAAALGAMRRALEPGGTWLATVRDYDELAADRPAGLPGELHEDDAGRRIVTQVWEWSADGDTVRVHHVVAREAGGEWDTTVRVTTMRAWPRSAITGALEVAGFDDVTWLTEEEAGWYQPVVTARSGA